MQLAGHPRQAANAGILANKVFLPQFGRQASERAFPVDSVSRCSDRPLAGVGCINVNLPPVKPTRLVKRHRDGERFLTSGTCCTPDVQLMVRMGTEILRNDLIHKDAYLVEFAPEERLLNRQRVKDLPPFTGGGRIIFEEVVVIQDRVKAPFDNQRRKAVEEHVVLSVVKVQPRPLVNEVPQKWKPTMRRADAQIERGAHSSFSSGLFISR